MIGAWLAFAQAADCPEPGAAIQSAADDVVRYFLQDAEIALTEAVAGFACTGPAEAGDLAAFWQVRGLIWTFLDDPRADLAFASARQASPTQFSDDFGAAARARWEAAPLATGRGRLELRGVTDADWVALDGVRIDPADAPAGLHVLQVGSADAARFARLVQIEDRAVVEVVVPSVGGSAPSMRVASTAWFEDVKPPIARTGGRYLDAEGDALSWRMDVQPLAAADPGGRASLSLFRTNTALQAVAVTVAAGSLYSSYLFGWDAGSGANLDRGVSLGLCAAGAATFVGAAVFEWRLIDSRRRLRSEVEASANRTLAEGM